MTARCPVCGTEAATGDRFCEIDGAALAPAAVGARVASGACPQCGARDADDGDGFCTTCGHRLPHDQLATEPPPAGLPPGAEIAGRVVEREGPSGSVWARGADGLALVVRGDGPALDLEGAALGALVGDPRAAKVRARVHDRHAGEALVLASAEGAEVSSLPAEKLTDACASVVELAALLESAGYGAAPAAGDIVVANDGTVRLLRLRGAATLPAGKRLDPRPFLAALGAEMPLAWIAAPVAAVRLITACRRGALSAPRDLDAARVELARARDTVVAKGTIGAAADPGLVRDHDQDATAYAAGEGWAVLVVCDGVSSSTRSAEASALAARITRDALAHFARSPDVDFEAAGGAVATSIRAAHIAVCGELGGGEESDLPGTTIVAALVHRGRVTVGWVGDSRAYWVAPGGVELLTRDHSWVTEVVAAGVMDEATARRAPEAHVITRCLGPLEVGATIAEAEPDVRGRELPGRGVLVVCSDGLWNYADPPSELARVFRAIPPDTSAEGVARALVAFAISRGGSDNVSVVAYQHGGARAW